MKPNGEPVQKTHHTRPYTVIQTSILALMNVEFHMVEYISRSFAILGKLDYLKHKERSVTHYIVTHYIVTRWFWC